MSTADKKLQALTKVYEYLGKYSTAVLVTLENVGSLQVQQVRRELNKVDALLVIGKNTIIKKAITWRVEGVPEGAEYDGIRRLGGKIPELAKLRDEFKGKLGIIFTKSTPIFRIKEIVEANKVSAPAKVGMISYLDVLVPAGPTGMEPAQISFFHALNISTKINKGQIEITKDYPVCQVGKKIGSSEVALLQKMNIRPFSFQMNVVGAYDGGAILDAETCKLTPDNVLGFFSNGVRNLAALSLQSGYPTQLSVSFAVGNAFKNLAAIGLNIDYKFAQIANAAQQAPVQQQQQQQQQPAQKVEAKKEEPKQEEPEEDFDMGDLFG